MERGTLKIEDRIHKSVMAKEIMEHLRPRPEGTYVDATLGLGGHTEAILESSGYKAKVIGLDVDKETLSIAKSHLSAFKPQVMFINKNFSEIDKVLEDLGIDEVDGIVADLGMSSYQIEMSGRGFSFRRAESLDMRMDTGLKHTAYELVNKKDEQEIAKIVREYGEEKWAKKVAREIVRSRREKSIESSVELAEIVSKAIPKKFHTRGIHPATKTFQAIRIAVNDELEHLEIFLQKAVPLLKIGGRIAVISFHSLEDRLVKNTFKKFSSPCVCPPQLPICMCGRKSILKILTRSPLTPSTEEVLNNPRSRSAKLRIGERI
jgi:16S rRNA (cytosine1402-N4)-methyltransferase